MQCRMVCKTLASLCCCNELWKEPVHAMVNAVFPGLRVCGGRVENVLGGHVQGGTKAAQRRSGGGGRLESGSGIGHLDPWSGDLLL